MKGNKKKVLSRFSIFQPQKSAVAFPIVLLSSVFGDSNFALVSLPEAPRVVGNSNSMSLRSLPTTKFPSLENLIDVVALLKHHNVVRTLTFPHIEEVPTTSLAEEIPSKKIVYSNFQRVRVFISIAVHYNGG